MAALDGATIEVLHSHHPEHIHLYGIDCPEKGQAYGNKTTQAIFALAFGKAVTLQTFGTDKYGCILTDMPLPDGPNINRELGKDGWCWRYRKCVPENLELARLERDARDAKRGRWADPAPMPRWGCLASRRNPQ